jgi:hypothetical protein
MECRAVSIVHGCTSCLMVLNRFRWVFCQLEVLRHCFPSNLRRILEELPKSLDDTYKRILKEINNANWVHAYRLLQCLVVASRPLQVEELAEVLAFDLSTGGIPKLNADWRWENQEQAVLVSLFQFGVCNHRRWLPDCSVLAFLCKRIPHLGSPRELHRGVPVLYSHRTFPHDSCSSLSRCLTLSGRPH